MLNDPHLNPDDRVLEALARGDPPTMVFRLAAGMSTSTLSALTGIALDRVEAIEAGEKPVGDELTILGRYLGIPADKLYRDGNC